MNLRQVFLLITLALSAIAGRLNAQQQPDTLQLGEVEVAARKLLAPASSLPLQQMDALRLQQTGSRSLADALRHFAGLNIRDYGGIGGLKTINLRSLGAQHTAVFIDDVPLSESASGQIDLSRITLETIESISLSSGGPDNVFRPARWFASASTIALQSAGMELNELQGHWEGNMTIGSAGLWQPYGRATMRLSDNTRLQVGARYAHATGAYRYRVENGSQASQWMTRNNTDLENFAWQSRLSSKGKKIETNWHLLFDYSDRGLPGAVMMYNPYSRQRLSNTDFNQALVLRGGRPSLRWQTLVKQSIQGMTYQDPDFLNAQGGLVQHYRQKEYYVSQLVGGNIRGVQLAASTDLVWNGLEARHLAADPSRLSALVSTSASWSNSRWELTAHGLLQYSAETVGQQQQTKSRSAWSPGISLAYRLRENHHDRLRFSYKDAFRMPTFNELYYNIVGNSNLLPERARMFNLGWSTETDGSIARLHISADAFYNLVRDKIIAIPTKNLFVWSMRNIGRMSALGLETSLRLETKLFDSWQAYGQLNYTFQHAVDRSSPHSPSYNHQIAYLPLHSLNGFAQLQYGAWSGGTGIFYNSGRYFLPENRPENYLKPWWTLDINALYRFNLAGYPSHVRLDVHNLFNRQYEVIRSFPMPGRMFMLTLGTKSRKS